MAEVNRTSDGEAIAILEKQVAFWKRETERIEAMWIELWHDTSRALSEKSQQYLQLLARFEKLEKAVNGTQETVMRYE